MTITYDPRAAKARRDRAELAHQRSLAKVEKSPLKALFR
jgi:hypothetical protein